MKRIFAFFLLVLVTLSVMLSLSSCQSVEDIKGVRQTESILKTNYYETVIFTEKKELETIGAADHLKSFLTAENEKGEKIMICYCKTAAAADTVLVEFEKMADESDDELIYEKNDKTVFLGTKKALKCATKKIWVNQLKQTFIEENNYKYVIEGLGNTLLITLGALVIGVILGVLIAVAKYYSEDNPKLKFVNFLCDFYTTVIRGIPITVLLLIFFFVIMVSAEGIIVAIIAFGINSGAYMAELVRSGINAVDKGQMEAARSLGMSKWQAMRTIIFPQAIKNILPAIGNECIALLKETSVAGYVAVVDLTRGVNLIRNNTYDAFNPLMLSALIYLTLVIGMTQLLKVFERRLKKSDRRINK